MSVREAATSTRGACGSIALPLAAAVPVPVLLGLAAADVEPDAALQGIDAVERVGDGHTVQVAPRRP